MPPPRFLFARRLCSASASASDPAGTLKPSTVSDAADLAAAAALRAPCLESRLLSQVPSGVLSDPDFARLTLSRLLPAPVPSLRFLRFLSSHLPAPSHAPDAAPAGASPPLPGVDQLLRRLPPHLAADAADLLASHLGIHPSLRTLNAASRTALRAARPDLVFRLFSAFSSSPDYPGDATTVGCLARAYAAQGRPLDGLHLLRDAARRGSPPPADAAADLAAAFAADGNFAKVSATLHLMIAAGCTPDSVVYQRIIHELFGRGMGEEALRVFREIKQRGYAINRIMYTTVIHGLFKMRRTREAQQMWDEMVDRGFEPNEYAYCSLVGYYFKAGDVEKARKVYDEMLEKGFMQTTVTCNILIKGFCVNERVYEALEVFEEMSIKGIKHDVITYNTLIQGLCRVGMLVLALRMYEWLASSSLEPTVSTFSPLIATMCKQGQVDAAVDLIKSMRAKGLEPLVWSNDSIINGFCKIGRSDEGMAWLAGMLKNNIKPRQETFNTLVESLSTSGRGHDALLILDIMFKVGFEIGRLACTILVDKLCPGNASYSHQLDNILASGQ
ncbi:pentatricopeptide repeat-containing protein At5g18950-like [Panicum virgatum]|uniref:Pentatricopeptide repeat-containing protein n=1 Tax=Panicum virgatum TaxID=38727 RepID=A0A8T0MTR4_PANVG|nr:pentatricopeptide repeat-containing protein At5g18950-like [Panicum virgatum]XP_039830635.1 pentatricopeptide repeat-containing protein At5g18950-like [Panicum virgatum]XP_039830636.1 pentatricopeptide repeat-containing protein At5g18950-like [Panicum virgatum]XP_039830637.1 pentatricopeptide repeat-containing protein At5g18950-like [Panicum virgatum]XP_039830638.1 pentatricopeptide repeat-containing protein At5g18950-like [Panicum virgatum]XP_039830639.1 pentatricopeptide repeat-containing